MDFQKVAACCADMVDIVRGTAFRLSVGKSVEYDFRSAFNSHFLYRSHSQNKGLI